MIPAPLEARTNLGCWKCNCGQEHENWRTVHLDLTLGAQAIMDQLLELRNLRDKTGVS